MQLNRFALSLVVLAAVVPSRLSGADALTFEKDVRPILKTHCFHCHGESGVKEGSLDVRLRRWMIAGGDSGEAILPGQPDQSRLLDRITSGEMPPGDKQLSSDEIAVIADWILQGAATARAEPETLDHGDYITEEERKFWSFQPIRRPSPPVVNETTINHPIDAFIHDRLAQSGLTFSPIADRYTLIRRATFDLWGLPPDPQMVDRFIDDDDPLAYQRLIDRLLASPRYGERWGRHWLDVAGYADSDGYTNKDVEREFAYFYRDYVIDSFNDDKPLDQIICEQLAGDEMNGGPSALAKLTRERITRLAATGFLRMAPDGSASGEVDRGLAVNATIADTIDIVTTSLLGLTVGCARCHDHRYDPISQADYYRFRAIFEPALDSKQWKLPMQRRVSLYTAEDKRQRAAIEATAKQAEAARSKRQQEHIARTLAEELLVAPDDRREQLKQAFETEKAKRTAEQVALLEEFPNIGNISPGSLYLYAEQRGRRAGEIEQAAKDREARYVADVRLDQLANVPAEKRDTLRRIIETEEAAWSKDQRALAAEYPNVFVAATSLETLRPDAFAEVRRYREAARICREQDAKTELAKMQEAILAIRNTAPQEKFVRVLMEPANHAPPTHLFIRGDHNQPDRQLEPAELTVLQSFAPVQIDSNDPDRSTTGRRLAYARHLTDGEHPLLARVLINRVWMHHFGRGIVATPGDFGFLGAQPTHPELLDWLADELMRGGWSLKRMHRMIMLSRTYQQISLRTEQLDRMDADNRLYARMSVRRLESEAIRDAVLAASGALIHHMHGPPVPVKEDAVGQIVLGKEMLDGERKPKGEQANFDGVARRSVYVQVRRSRPLAVLETFDIAGVVPNCTSRNYSNVAPQSLLLMNSPFAIDHADQLAGHVIDAEKELPQQLAVAWKRCFARPVSNSVLVELMQFVRQQTAVFQSRDSNLTPPAAHRLALASACHAMLSSNQFLYVD
ncbi:DUF1553 domain-containing protein [Planctomycetes bacterium TBK1r]|uniref:Planctomycete cytochrome C n=1 Tax=Stieleria magnilauensis TaxID=2527963 RepID=A0ABX5XZF7_9BACT|nr:Planctomycete cytochrome C [Planctomycetes bacterium TBK1r]